MQEYVDDSDGKQELIQQNDAVFESFMCAIQRTAPVFLPYDSEVDSAEVKGGNGNEMDVYDIRRELRA
jgi:hypothetical protein